MTSTGVVKNADKTQAKSRYSQLYSIEKTTLKIKIRVIECWIFLLATYGQMVFITHMTANFQLNA